MSVDYFVYSEIQIDGKWHCIDYFTTNLKKNEHVIAPTMWSGSRSYFQRTFEKLKEIGGTWNSENISEDVKRLMFEDGELPEFVEAVSVPFESILKAAMSKFKGDSFGFVLKSDVYRYETEGDDIVDVLDAAEYEALSTEAKKAYMYYGCDPFEWVGNFRTIISAVNARYRSWQWENTFIDLPLRVVAFALY